MSLISTIAIVILLILAVAYVIGQFTTHVIKTDIRIDAPPSVVWQVLATGEDYPHWNPFMKHMSGAFRQGGKLAITVAPPGGSPMDFTPTVLVAEPGRELRWIGRLWVRGIFDGEHYFILTETSDGHTNLHHGERFRGTLVAILKPMIGINTKKGFEAMNEALKARAEAEALSA